MSPFRKQRMLAALHMFVFIFSSLLEFQHGVFASKNIRAPKENACTAGYKNTCIRCMLNKQHQVTVRFYIRLHML